ncbi:MAG: hypothetical protein ACT4OJ_08705 [Bacteroidota bacterium]
MPEIKAITPKQVIAIRAALHRHNLLKHKEEIIDSYTKGRTVHISEMTGPEAGELLSYLNAQTKDMNVSSRLMAKLFAMCHEMGWVPQQTVIEGDKVKTKKDYSRVHGWVLKYGYLKKPLREYTYKELPKLVTQLEKHVYEPFIQNISSQKKDSPFN